MISSGFGDGTGIYLNQYFTFNADGTTHTRHDDYTANKHQGVFYAYEYQY